MEITRITQKEVTVTLTATRASGLSAQAHNVSVALLPQKTTPTKNTIWMTVPVVNNVVTFFICGADAPRDGTLVAPPGKTDLWAKTADNPEQDAVFIESVLVR